MANAYIEFLKKHAGKGYSGEQLREMYAAEKAKKSKRSASKSPAKKSPKKAAAKKSVKKAPAKKAAKKSVRRAAEYDEHGRRLTVKGEISRQGHHAPSKYNEFIARKTRGGKMTLSDAAKLWSAGQRR